jgi:type VI secretion system protein ImpM
MSGVAGETGFYGKLPCRGDFLQRRAPQAFVETWDAWLQECMHASRQQLQEAWLDRYLTGAVWRFALTEGICGNAAYAGILVPSVDRVGRYFPLTVITQLEAGCALDTVCHAVPWFEAAEALVLEALAAEQMDFDQFDERIAQLAKLLDSGAANELSTLSRAVDELVSSSPRASWHVPLASDRSLQRALNVLAYRELARTLGPLASWWTEGSSALGPTWLCTRGLPDAATFAAMLSGDWPGAKFTTADSSIVASEAAGRSRVSQPQ